MKSRIFFFFIFLFSLVLLLSFTSAEFGYDNPNLPKIVPPELISQNITNVNQTNVTNINQFDQSLNTTDNVQFQNLTLSDKITFAFGEIIDNIVNGWIRITGNLNVTGNITPSLNNTFSLGSPDLLWKDLYLGNSSIYLDNYILDVFDGNFRIRNETTDIMYFNQTANEMVFTTNTRTIGFAEGASPLKLREGVQFFNVAGVKGFSIYHAHGTEEWRNVSDIFNASVVFELDEKDNPYGMDWIIWDKLTQRPPLVINFGEEGRATTFDRSLRIGKANSPVDENFTLCTNLACNSSDVADLEVEGSIWAGRNITANYFIGDGSQLIGITGLWNRTGTVLSPKTAGDDISLKFGDFVSEQNPDAVDAIRIKATNDVDVVLGDSTGYFSVWNTADNTAVFFVNNVGNTDVLGDLTIGDDIFMSEDGIIGISASTERIVFDGTGGYINLLGANVGIGTISPDSAFHIKANTPGTVGSHPAGQLIIQDPDDTVFGNAVITGYESDGSGNPDQQLWYLGSSSSSNSNIIFLNRRNALLQFGTSGSTRMTILGNGDVGIGTTSPDSKLQIDGNFTSETNSTDSIGTSAIKWLSGFFVNLFVSGDLNVTGNITSENVFIPQYIYSHTNATIPILGVNTWTNITFAQEDTDINFGISHTYNDNTNQTFTIMQDGVYEIDFDIDVEDTSVGASDVDIAGRVIYVNGTEVIGSDFETDITKQGVETELSHDFLARFNSGDEIIVQFVATDGDVQISTHGTFGDHPESVSVVIKKIANL